MPQPASGLFGTVLASVGLWFAGCSAADDTAAPQFERIQVRPAEDAASWLKTVVRERFEPLIQPEAWDAEAPVRTVQPRLEGHEPYGETPDVLVLGAARPEDVVRLTRRGPCDVAACNLVRVVAGLSGYCRLEVKFSARGRELGRADVRVDPPLGQRSVNPADVRTLDLDIPAAVSAAESIDALELRLFGETRAMVVHSVELIQRPLESLLPDPAGPPRAIEVATDTLYGVGVSNRVPVVADLRATPGAELVFSYAAPRAASNQSSSLVLRLGNEAGGTEVRRLEPGAGAWLHARVPLGKLDGPVRARFELDAVPGKAAVCAIANVAVVRPSASPPPTVVLVTTDTHRGDHIGAAPDGVPIATPVLDALAARGALFTRCYSWTNVTNPSHVAIMTGHHLRDTGITDNRTRLAASARTLADVFRARGYLTWASVSAYHVRMISGLDQGFDRISGPSTRERRAGGTVDRVIAWKDARAGRPLFLWVHVFDAHWPYAPPAGFESPIRGPVEHLPEVLRDGVAGAFPDVRVAKARYRGEVAYLDRELGRLFDHVGLDDAVVAVVGDHGESFGAHGLYFDHVGLYPNTLHVPLIVCAPPVTPGRRVSGLVAQADLGRTLIDLAGLADAEFPGTNLLDRPASEDWPSTPFFALHSNATAASLTKDGYHFVLQLRRPLVKKPSLYDREAHAIELYDLRRDPRCERDLQSAELERARAMRASLIGWLSSRRDLGWVEGTAVDENSIAELRALGYVGTTAPPSELWLDDDCEHCRRFQ